MIYAFGLLVWFLLSIVGGVATGVSHAAFTRRAQGTTSGELFGYICVAFVAILIFKFFGGNRTTPPAGKGKEKP